MRPSGFWLQSTAINRYTIKIRNRKMKTIKQQLDAALAIYLIHVGGNDRSITDRYSAYILTVNGLEVLWPFDDEMGDDALLQSIGMKYSKRRQYPAYHFVEIGYGYNKVSAIITRLSEYAGRRIPGFTLTGHSPSPISEDWSRIFDGKPTVA